MKRKSWISIVCGGLLLIALAMPAAAAGDDAPRFALLERVMSWIESWAPTGAPGSGWEREAAADAQGGLPGEIPGTANGSCEACNNHGEITSVIDPDG